mmetsp:Transcript_33682/g.106085  ORF Transcript_33682/g.106085 Transcript_33682/m.106085 type:complete len:205 (+) Transcript_33682:1199-1813(+)
MYRAAVAFFTHEPSVKVAVRTARVHAPPGTARKSHLGASARLGATSTHAPSDEVSVTRASASMSLSGPSLIATSARVSLPDSAGRLLNAAERAKLSLGAMWAVDTASGLSATGEGSASTRGGTAAGSEPPQAVRATLISSSSHDAARASGTTPTACRPPASVCVTLSAASTLTFSASSSSVCTSPLAYAAKVKRYPTLASLVKL